MTLRDQTMALPPESERLSVWPGSAWRGLSLSGLTCNIRGTNFRNYDIVIPLLSGEPMRRIIEAVTRSKGHQKQQGFFFNDLINVYSCLDKGFLHWTYANTCIIETNIRYCHHELNYILSFGRSTIILGCNLGLGTSQIFGRCSMHGPIWKTVAEF